VLAGLAVASLLIPQSIAFATLATLPPISGLYTALVFFVITLSSKLPSNLIEFTTNQFSSFTYAILGSSRQLSVGPEATGAILLGFLINIIHFIISPISGSSHFNLLYLSIYDLFDVSPIFSSFQSIKGDVTRDRVEWNDSPYLRSVVDVLRWDSSVLDGSPALWLLGQHPFETASLWLRQCVRLFSFYHVSSDIIVDYDYSSLLFSSLFLYSSLYYHKITYTQQTGCHGDYRATGASAGTADVARYDDLPDAQIHRPEHAPDSYPYDDYRTLKHRHPLLHPHYSHLRQQESGSPQARDRRSLTSDLSLRGRAGH